MGIFNQNKIRKKAKHLLRNQPAAIEMIGWMEKQFKIVFNRFLHQDAEPEIIKNLKTRLYSLGFTERAVKDLEEIVACESRHPLKREAAWVLAIWHAGQRNKAGARRALEYLSICRQDGKKDKWLRRTAIVAAECHAMLGDISSARQVIFQAIKKVPENPDFLLAAANLETTLPEKLAWINKILARQGLLEIKIGHGSNDLSFYDQLKTQQTPQDIRIKADGMPKVTIIMPAYNSEREVATALASLIAQTWQNIEILVVDDCSTDNTAEVVAEYAQQDHRIQLMRAPENGGPYVARNLALSRATGDFVTCNDADDWSHPQKIEKQVLHLINNPSLVGNTSQYARATSDLQFYRHAHTNFYIQKNLSSFMFRRAPVFQKAGYWDSVRFGADSEFVRRVKKIFGKEKMVDLPMSLLSFPRQTSDSLTAHESFGASGYHMGARKEYFEQQMCFHKNHGNLYYAFPQAARPFPVPAPMLPYRAKATASTRRFFDVIVASDFRVTGEAATAIIYEIKTQKQTGLRIGLAQLHHYDGNPDYVVNEAIRGLLDGDQVQMLVYGEKVACAALIICSPSVLQEWQRFFPDIDAKAICVIVDQLAMSDYGENGSSVFDIRKCAGNMNRYFGTTGTWYPAGPLIRQVLREHHQEELSVIRLADKDWSHIASQEIR